MTAMSHTSTLIVGSLAVSTLASLMLARAIKVWKEDDMPNDRNGAVRELLAKSEGKDNRPVLGPVPKPSPQVVQEFAGRYFRKWKERITQ